MENQQIEKPVDLTEILRSAPRDCWLALNEDYSEIIGQGRTLAEALEQAKQRGYEDPIIHYSPKDLIHRVF